MSCLYCGSSVQTKPVNICICGRSGSWTDEYAPRLIECRPQFDTPDWLRTLRRWYFAFRPANGPIIAAALAHRNRTETRRSSITN